MLAAVQSIATANTQSAATLQQSGTCEEARQLPCVAPYIASGSGNILTSLRTATDEETAAELARAFCDTCVSPGDDISKYVELCSNSTNDANSQLIERTEAVKAFTDAMCFWPTSFNDVSRMVRELDQIHTASRNPSFCESNSDVLPSAIQALLLIDHDVSPTCYAHMRDFLCVQGSPDSTPCFPLALQTQESGLTNSGSAAASFCANDCPLRVQSLIDFYPSDGVCVFNYNTLANATYATSSSLDFSTFGRSNCSNGDSLNSDVRLIDYCTRHKSGELCVDVMARNADALNDACELGAAVNDSVGTSRECPESCRDALPGYLDNVGCCEASLAVGSCRRATEVAEVADLCGEAVEEACDRPAAFSCALPSKPDHGEIVINDHSSITLRCDEGYHLDCPCDYAGDLYRCACDRSKTTLAQSCESYGWSGYNVYCSNDAVVDLPPRGASAALDAVFTIVIWVVSGTFAMCVCACVVIAAPNAWRKRRHAARGGHTGVAAGEAVELHNEA